MTTENFTSLQTVYCAASGRNMPLSLREHYLWAEWSRHGWAESDLRLVIAFIQRRIKAGRRFPESLRLHNLLDPARFADDKLDAEAEAKAKPARTARQRVLEASGRKEHEIDRVKSAGQVLRESEALKALLQVRDNL